MLSGLIRLGCMSIRWLLPRRARWPLSVGEIGPLADAVQRYTGAFLHGFGLPASAEFDAWVNQERQYWERRYLDALAMLVDSYTTSGAYPQAIAAAQRALAVDELAEDMHRSLIALYAATGDRSGALRQFERCAVVLERELGVSPLPETRAVYESVRDGRYGGTATRENTATRSAMLSHSPGLRCSPSRRLPSFQYRPRR